MCSTTTDAGPDSASAPRVLSLRLLHRGWGSFSVARLRLADGTEVEREIEDHGDAVAVLPYDPERREALLVRQLRAPALVAAGLATTLEAPAGRRLQGEDPAACAAREAMEECGVALGPLDRVATAWAMPAVSTERIHLFLATYRAADRIGPGGGLAEEGESVTIEVLSLAELARRVDEFDLTDMKTMLLVFALRHRHPNLFTS